MAGLLFGPNRDETMTAPRPSRLKRLRLGALLPLVLLISSPAAAQDSAIQDLLSIQSDLNTMCRGWPGDDPHINEVCAVRDKTDRLLNRLGYCYGAPGQADSQMQWHKCGSP
jgi:hypothetical protein